MDKQIILDSFKPLINEYSWNVKKGHGSFLTFEFGQPLLEIGDQKIWKTSAFPFDQHQTRSAVIHGLYHLWIYCCNWKIHINDKQIAFEEFSDEDIKNATEFLNGQKLVGVTIDTKNAVTKFKFDLEGELLTCNQSYEQGIEMWMLYMPEQVLTFNNIGQFKLTDKDGDVSGAKFESVESEVINMKPA